ncbi:MAG TPA: efflux RND transporter permease subunit [Fimbriiglobus sp.]|jgi:multidrug efflux pump subunit AcrB
MANFATIARPYLGAVVLTCGLLTAGGIYSAIQMPSSVYPEVQFQRIAVIAKVPDRDVASMEVNVTRVLEEAVSGVTGVGQVRSKTIRGGSELSVDFNPGTDMRRAEQLTWNRIGARRSELPPNAELTVEQLTPSIFPILSLVLTGGDSQAQLRDFAYYDLAPRIKNIPDVLYATVAGGDVREIEVICRPDDLLAHGLSAADVADQIGQLSQLQPVGLVENQPLAFQIIVDSLPNKVGRVENLVLSTRMDQPVRVRDVADVKVLHRDRTLSIGYDQQDAVVITVFRRLGGNTVQISKDVAALLKERTLSLAADDPRKKPPRNIRAAVVYDQAAFIQTAVDNVRDAIVIGGLFSVLVLLAFLRSWRATLISALAIPITLSITFLFLHWSGETLNLMSLGGLAVAIGLIIDDTVVVVENIARHLADRKADGSGSEDAVDAASGEITGAVVGSSLTTVLVFVPLALVVGVYGQFFAALSWSLSIAVLVSMVVSLTLVPVIAAKFLAGRPMPGPGPIYRAVSRVYEFVLSGALRVPWLLLAISIAAVGIGVGLYTGIPDLTTKREPGKPPPPPLWKGLETGLMPSMDEGAFILDYWAPSGTPLAETERKVREVEKILSKNPDVQTYLRRAGSENGLFATQTSRGDITVILRPAEEDPVSLFKKPVRPPLPDLEKELTKAGKSLEQEKDHVRAKYRRRPLKMVMDEVEDEVKDVFAENQLKVELIQIMEDELNDLSGADKPVEVKLFGPDQVRLRKLAEEVSDALGKSPGIPGIKEINSNVRGGNPDLKIRLDGFYTDKVGLKPDAVARQLKAIFQGQIATQIPESSRRMTDVRVRYPDAIRFGKEFGAAGKSFFNRQRILDQWILLPESKLPAPTTAGGSPTGPLAGMARAIPVRGLGDVQAVRTPDEQWRENQQPAIFVTADINEDEAGLGSVVRDIQSRMAKDVSMPPGYRWEIGGHYLRMQEAFRSLLVVMIVAILLVFITLAFQFQSVVLPMLIFLTQPLSLVSGLIALYVTGTPLNVSSYMGAILLIGLDMKNGIILVEYIQQLRKEGMALKPALLHAGRTRFRPILMTSIAAVLGMVPLALGIGPGAQMQQPLAIMVIGGLTANMLFTRMVIPAGFLILERRKERFAAKGRNPSEPVPLARPLENANSAAVVSEPAAVPPPAPPILASVNGQKADGADTPFVLNLTPASHPTPTSHPIAEKPIPPGETA